MTCETRFVISRSPLPLCQSLEHSPFTHHRRERHALLLHLVLHRRKKCNRGYVNFWPPLRPDNPQLRSAVRRVHFLQPRFVARNFPGDLRLDGRDARRERDACLVAREEQCGDCF